MVIWMLYLFKQFNFSDTSILCENDRLDLRSTFSHITYPINFIYATALILDFCGTEIAVISTSYITSHIMHFHVLAIKFTILNTTRQTNNITKMNFTIRFKKFSRCTSSCLDRRKIIRIPIYLRCQEILFEDVDITGKHSVK